MKINNDKKEFIENNGIELSDEDIDKVFVNQIADCAVVGDEISEMQAPRAPVSTHLADDELVLCLGFCDGLVNLHDGVDVLIINLFQRGLSVGCGHDKHGGQNNK